MIKQPLNYYFGLFALLMLSLPACKSAGRQEENQALFTQKPNVIIIYPDQLRRYSAGFWSEPQYRADVIGKPDPAITPTIDHLAKNGVVFTRAIVNYPLCSPSRGMILSGSYPEQNGIWNNARVGREDGLKEGITTITDWFSNQGYDIGYFGKAHFIKPVPVFNGSGDYIGTEDAPGGQYVNDYDTYVPPGPDRHSIDYFYQVLKDQHSSPFVYSNDPLVVDGKADGEQFEPHEFSTKIESETIIQYLKNEHNQRDETKPFFMFWSINPPHSPWDNENTDMEEYRRHYDTDKYPTIDSTLVVRANAEIEVASYARNYFANVTSIDKYIGKVLSQMENMKLLENTIVIFTADHGEMLGSHGLTAKNVLYTEAMAVPFIVYWRKGIGSGKTDVLLGSPDIFPTLANLTGIESPLPQSVEGKDLSVFIKNPENKENKPTSILLMLGNSRGLQTRRYTLVLKENKAQWDEQAGTEISEAYIFDNDKDPYQFDQIPLDKQSDLGNELLKELAIKLQEANDPWFQQRKYKNIIPYSEIKQEKRLDNTALKHKKEQ